MSLVFPEKKDLHGIIEYPSYTVDLDIYQNHKKLIPLEKKIQLCAQRSFQLISIFFVSFKDAFLETLGSTGTSFKYIVLNYYGSWSQIRFPENAHLIVFKIVFWVASMGWGISATTSRLFLKRISPDHSLLLKQFASDEINVDHIKTEESSLDASNVPEGITVDTLRELFHEINFDNPNAPGYMAEGTRREETRILSKEELENQLNTFIHRVNTREAFLGTPPGYDVPRLMDFYQQIEDAVRLSIDKLVKDVAEFETQNGTNISNFSIEQKRTYNNLLETRARLVLDLAIAGSHCGARYMGEAMDAYYNIYNAEGISNDKDLQGTLIEILAKKREEIAKEEAQKLGSDTHEFTKYMGNMGRLLGIPGTKNIIEHLSSGIDTYQLLNDFFQRYTVDTIINTIQEKVKVSKTFREKITDWIKDQTKDWNHEKYKDINGIARSIENIRNNSLTETPLSLHFQIFQEILIHLKNEKTVLPRLQEDWDDFLTELFALDEAKEELKNRFPRENDEQQPAYTLRFRQLVNSIKASCSKAALGSELLQQLQERIASGDFRPVPFEQYLPRFIEKQKIQEMKKVLPMAKDDSLLRLLNDKKTNLIEFIQNHQKWMCQGDFLDFLDLENIIEKITSSSKEDLTGTKNLTDDEHRTYQRLIEWILVSQKILRPQIESKQNEVMHIDLAENQVESYAQTVHRVFYNEATDSKEVKNLIPLEKLLKLLRNREENAEEVFSHIPTTPNIRYREGAKFKRNAVLTWVFEQSFQKNPSKIVAAAEEASKQVFYPKWKEVCLIQLSKVPGDILCNIYFKIALTVSALFVSIFSIYEAHARVSQFFAARGIPFIINHVPVQIIQAGNTIIGAKEFIWRNPLKVLAVIWLIREGIKMLPETPYLSAAARSIDLWKVFERLISSPQTIFRFALDLGRSISVISSVWWASQNIGQRFRKISSNAEKEREIAYRQKSLGVWKNCQVALA